MLFLVDWVPAADGLGALGGLLNEAVPRPKSTRRRRAGPRAARRPSRRSLIAHLKPLMLCDPAGADVTEGQRSARAANLGTRSTAATSARGSPPRRSAAPRASPASSGGAAPPRASTRGRRGRPRSSSGSTASTAAPTGGPGRLPPPGWVEQHGEALWGSALAACAELLEDGGRRAALGITNQRETVVVFERDTLRWSPRRRQAAAERGDLRGPPRRGRRARVRARTGLLLDPYFTASKLERLLRERPELGRGRSAATSARRPWTVARRPGHRRPPGRDPPLEREPHPPLGPPPSGLRPRPLRPLR